MSSPKNNESVYERRDSGIECIQHNPIIVIEKEEVYLDFLQEGSDFKAAASNLRQVALRISSVEDPELLTAYIKAARQALSHMEASVGVSSIEALRQRLEREKSYGLGRS